MRQLSALQKGMAARESEIESLRTELAATTSELQAERGRLTMLTEEHRRERGRLEQRASDHEKRLLEDVDRARLEAKRLKLVVADESKKAGQALADSQQQVQSLNVQVGALRAENAGLTRELLSAREDLRTAHLHQDQFRKDTMALLVDLKARIPKEASHIEAPRKRSKTNEAPKRR